jgi:hypothetical protein
MRGDAGRKEVVSKGLRKELRFSSCLTSLALWDPNIKLAQPPALPTVFCLKILTAKGAVAKAAHLARITEVWDEKGRFSLAPCSTYLQVVI